MMKLSILSFITSLILISCSVPGFPSSSEEMMEREIPETSIIPILEIIDPVVSEATVTPAPATLDTTVPETPISPVVSPIDSVTPEPVPPVK